MKNAEVAVQLERSFERRVRNRAYELGMQVEVENLTVYLAKEGHRTLLCTANDPKHLWRQVWQSITQVRANVA